MTEGVRLRRAEPGDELAVAAVHVRAWQTAYHGLLPAYYLDALRPEQRAARYTFGERDPRRPVTVVAVEGERVVGFVTTCPARDADVAGFGEVAALYVDPDRWRHGIGHALMEDGRARLARAGHDAAIVWTVERENRARAFYEADGWRLDGARRRTNVQGVPVPEVRYRRSLP